MTVCRHVERNARRANLVKRAEAWRWSSLWHRVHGANVPWLTAWPMAVPADWTAYVNRPETEAALASLRRSVVRGAPCGDAARQQQTAQRLGLESSLRNRGRPLREGGNK